MIINRPLYRIQAKNAKLFGREAAAGYMVPLVSFLESGNVSDEFIRRLAAADPAVIARALYRGGSDEEVINRICRRIRVKQIFR